MKTSNHLLVFLGGVHVADVTRARGGALSMEYTPEGLTPHATPVSLSLPPSTERYGDARVEHFLDGLLPERSEVRTAMKAHYGLPATDTFTLLHGSGLDCAGAVQFCPPDRVDEIHRAGGLTPETDSDIESRLAEMEMDDETSWVKRFEHWSLAGVQPKFALRNEDGHWFSAHGSEATTHIFKPGVHRMKMQALDEHVTLRAAAAVGLDCAPSDWAEFKSQSAIVSTRYDRERRGGEVVRLHQEDFHQVLGLGISKYEYDAAGNSVGVSATSILEALHDYSGDAETEHASVSTFVDSLIFSALAGATDGHAKNFSVLLDGQSVRLAPLYDMASDLPYDTRSDRLAMGIGGERSMSKIESGHWERLAKDARLDGGYVVERVHEIAKALPGAFEGAFAAVGPEADTLRKRTMPRLKEHAAGVASRASRPVSATASSSAGNSGRGDKTWVPEHVRNGRRVAGHWRRNR